MSKLDTPFTRHWLYYVVLKYVLIALASHISTCEFVVGRRGAVTNRTPSPEVSTTT